MKSDDGLLKKKCVDVEIKSHHRVDVEINNHHRRAINNHHRRVDDLLRTLGPTQTHTHIQTMLSPLTIRVHRRYYNTDQYPPLPLPIPPPLICKSVPSV